MCRSVGRSTSGKMGPETLGTVEGNVIVVSWRGGWRKRKKFSDGSRCRLCRMGVVVVVVVVSRLRLGLALPPCAQVSSAVPQGSGALTLACLARLVAESASHTCGGMTHTGTSHTFHQPHLCVVLLKVPGYLYILCTVINQV